MADESPKRYRVVKGIGYTAADGKSGEYKPGQTFFSTDVPPDTLPIWVGNEAIAEVQEPPAPAPTPPAG